MAIVERGKNTQSDQGRQPESPFSRPREQTFGDLISNPQVRRWAVRVAVALGVGLLFAFVFDIRVGLTLAVITVIADTIRRARLNSSVDAWQKSSAAERRTERQLRALEKNGWRILHARAVPRDGEGASDGKIDHLVIGPSGVYAIDSEKWDKRLPVRTLSHRKLFHGPFNKKDRLDEACWEAGEASRLLSDQVGFEVPVQPSVAIYGPSIPWKVMTVRDVDVYSGGRARAYLRRRPKVLTETDIQRIVRAAEQKLPPVYAQDGEQDRTDGHLGDGHLGDGQRLRGRD
ncbi:MAG: nuclease-related domain-containing protein [Actinomadura sp.]